MNQIHVIDRHVSEIEDFLEATMRGQDLSEDKVQSILRDVVESLVEDPSDSYVEMDALSDSLRFTVDVPEEERAKIIGSNGRVIKGLHSVIGALGGKMGKDIDIEIRE
jgi:predicted RNA-binding protein YlqC (UPF0109 family)